MREFLFVLLIILQAHSSFGQAYISSNRKLKVPPRIIRTCCAFGSDVGIVGIPFLKYTETTSIEKLGNHVYMGSKDEGNGIVYTCKGGFIDIGHLRDQADWTAFLYDLINNNIGKSLKIKLGHEGGVKRLELDIPDDFLKKDAIALAGMITYDLSVWHEISTWYGVSSVPFIPERYSAFSVEDDFSNMLGVVLGMRALNSEQAFEPAMSNLLFETLDSLDVVESEEETLKAMEEVHNEWWTREKKLPSRKIIIKRDISDYLGASPFLVTDDTNNCSPIHLMLAQTDSNNELLNNYYQLDFKLNRKFPIRKIFSDKKGRRISQDDFLIMLDDITEDVNRKMEVDNMRKQKKQERKADKG